MAGKILVKTQGRAGVEQPSIFSVLTGLSLNPSPPLKITSRKFDRNFWALLLLEADVYAFQP